LKIHFISNLFAPDELAGAALFSDLALYLMERGHEVRVTCCFPYYPAWKLRPEDVGVMVRDESFESIPVRRISMRVPPTPSGKGRMLADVSFLLSLLRRGRHPGWTPEVVLTAIPMLSQAVAQRFLYAGMGIPRLIIVQDFVVEAALELGILKFPGIAPVLHGLQRWALQSAATLVTIGPPMLEKLRRAVGQNRRTLLIPNWIHGSLQREINRQRSQARARTIRQLFYAGNLGVKQGLPDFLTTFAAAQASRSAGAQAGGDAKGCRIHDDAWSLRIHGGGAELDLLRSAVDQTPGCSLGGVLNEPEYISSLLSATACLVTQRPGVGANFLPSKLLPALATGTPVLAVCERSSPLAFEVLDGGFGEVIEPGNAVHLASVLSRWTREPETIARHGQRATERARRYSRETILKQYEAELLRLVGQGG
jgi:colanic acid biosynthesis glycosyl transferase WcaI